MSAAQKGGQSAGHPTLVEKLSHLHKLCKKAQVLPSNVRYLEFYEELYQIEAAIDGHICPHDQALSRLAALEDKLEKFIVEMRLEQDKVYYGQSGNVDQGQIDVISPKNDDDDVLDVELSGIEIFEDDAPVPSDKDVSLIDDMTDSSDQCFES